VLVGTGRLFSAVVAGGLVVALTACGSGSGNAADSDGIAKGAPIKIGVLTSLSGGYSSGFVTVEKAIKARFGVENAKGGVNGHKLEYVMADDTSTPDGAAKAVRKLIQQDKVFGIIDASPVFYGAAALTKQSNIPVAGASFDGSPAWLDKSYTNLFDAYGYGDSDLAFTTYGKYFKNQGATKVAAVGNVSPSSASSAAGVVISAEKAGLQRGYLDTKLQPGSTDVGPVVLAIKNSKSDALYMSVPPATAFAVIAGLHQAGVKLKASVLATGYGGALLQSAAAVTVGQGIGFATSLTPVEANTPQTKAFQQALSQYAGETSQPDFGEYVGWITADLFIYGLNQAGDTVTSTSFIDNTRKSTYDGGGLEKPTDFSAIKHSTPGLGPDGCINILTLSGKKFVPVAGANPICGEAIPGVDPLP
jgi:ABC-type branched-subunit amino acid transport system substrate-binding protein